MAKRPSKYSSRGLKTSYISTTVGVSLVLFMIALILGGEIFFAEFQKGAKESIEADIFFNPEVNEEDKKQIEGELKTWKEFSKVQFISQDRALEILEQHEAIKSGKEHIDFFEGEVVIPANIMVSPKSDFATKEGMKKITEKLMKEYKGRIHEVNYDEASLEEVNTGFQKSYFLFASAAFLLIFIAIALINNTIRLALYSKRFSIKTMQLVGATSSYIRRPFIFQAVGIGVISGIIGMALFLAFLYIFKQVSEIQIEVNPSVQSYLYILLSLIGVGIVLTVISTWFALNKFLRMKLDDLY